MKILDTLRKNIVYGVSICKLTKRIVNSVDGLLQIIETRDEPTVSCYLAVTKSPQSLALVRQANITIAVHQVGPEQEQCIEFYQRENFPWPAKSGGLIERQEVKHAMTDKRTQEKLRGNTGERPDEWTTGDER